MLLDFNLEARQKMIREFEKQSKELTARGRHILIAGFPKTEEPQQEKDKKNEAN